MKKPRGILIAGNWKMNCGLRETEEFFSGLRSELETSKEQHPLSLLESKGMLRACLIPPFLSLQRAMMESLKFPFPLSIGAQNAHWEKKGAYTGEVSGPMLKELGVEWVLVGHSERRQYFGETDTTARLRTESLLNQGFNVILCIGETREQRENGRTGEVLTQQLTEVIPQGNQGISHFLNGKLILAYEPVWAIGTGLTATPAQAEESHAMIRNLLRVRNGITASEQTPILYGGSVTPENIDSLLACPNIDGTLVGGASLKPGSFLSLLSAGAKVLSP